ncbi:DUF1365-domain-containing protein [Amniculicola lignicola CBS 123094]|uniref:DUF1365-domain-containing protein n=1 Tax=Amniculicola lignicola CBS 123094 TaxID=1392246 RepID=A0A6A5X537_9PLEO|nr:DUF1365-domain-containing protein [Amniculicola lignicola CBS 123094]
MFTQQTRSSLKGLLVLTVSSSLSLLPCCIHLGSNVGLGVVVWMAGGALRWWYGDRGVLRDCVIFGVVNGIVLREGLGEVLGRYSQEMGLIGSGVWSPVVRYSMLGFVLIVGFASWQFYQGHRANAPQRYYMTRDYVADKGKEEMRYPKSLIIPSRTTHARMFPKRHAFNYSYLLYGIPITPMDTVNGADIGLGHDCVKGSWWLQVRAEDYLQRGYGELGFYAKLKSWLREQGVEDKEWSYAYLVTAPRFWGYSFNPVSFWYIYDRDHELKRMILEVNNTFGERRIYLLDGSSPPSPPNTEAGKEGQDAKDIKFRDVWAKDFHVSPFNSLKGAYALKAVNPFPSPSFPNPQIDNTITLKSSKDHGKIVARVFSTGPPLDAENLTILETIQFISRWWWVGLVTFPRIIKEAWKLFFLRKLNVFFRPEPLSSSIGRAPTTSETAIQKYFKEYLEHLINHSAEQWNITYHTSMPSQHKMLLASWYIHGRPINPKIIDFRILTPAFYSRFIHYAHTSEALDRECFFAEEKNRTVETSHPEAFPLLLTPKEDAREALKEDQRWWDGRRSYLDEVRWMLLRRLRCAPPEPAVAATSKSTDPDVKVRDIRALPYSDLDKLMRGRGGWFDRGEYRRLVTKMFLAQRFAAGLEGVVDGVDFGVRVGMCWIGSRVLIAWGGDMERGGEIEWWKILGVGLGVCACHLYGLAKGYR